FITAFFLALMVVFASPFDTLASVPADGNGLSPLLRNPAMLIHPPMLYTGYVGFSVPFAFAVGALITRRTGAEWIRATRRFTLLAWMFLGCGVLLGALWSYSELGWGGYWAWGRSWSRAATACARRTGWARCSAARRSSCSTTSCSSGCAS